MIGSSVDLGGLGSTLAPISEQTILTVITASMAGEREAFVRGLCSAVAQTGIRVRILEYQSDDNPAEVVDEVSGSDSVLKFSGHGDLDRLVEEILLAEHASSTPVILIDQDASLTEVLGDPDHFRRRTIPQFDAVMVCSGGPRACEEYIRLGARKAGTLYPAIGPNDSYPTLSQEHLECDLLCIADRGAETDPAVEELFIGTAETRPDCSFILAGAGWDEVELPNNIRHIGPVPAKKRSAAYSSARFVLCVTPETVKERGFCPSYGMFEAAGAGACIISDSWPGLSSFFRTDTDILVALSARDVSVYLDAICNKTAARMGNNAWEKVHAHHMAGIRAEELLSFLQEFIPVGV